MSPEKQSDGAGFDPTNHECIGECVVCGDDVYPANPDQIGESEPVAHEECGW